MSLEKELPVSKNLQAATMALADGAFLAAYEAENEQLCSVLVNCAIVGWEDAGLSTADVDERIATLSRSTS